MHQRSSIIIMLHHSALLLLLSSLLLLLILSSSSSSSLLPFTSAQITSSTTLPTAPITTSPNQTLEPSTTAAPPPLRRSENFTIYNATTGDRIPQPSPTTYEPIELQEEDLTTNFALLPPQTSMQYLLNNSAIKLTFSLGNSGLKFDNDSRLEPNPSHPLFAQRILKCAQWLQSQVTNISGTPRAVGTDAQSLPEVSPTMFNPAGFNFSNDRTQMNVTFIRSFYFDIVEEYSFRLNFGGQCLNSSTLSTQRDISRNLFDVDFIVKPMRSKKVLLFGRGANMSSLDIATGIAFYDVLIVGDRFVGTGFNNATATGLQFDDLCPRNFFSVFGCFSVNVSYSGRYLRVLLETNTSFYVREPTTVNIPLLPQYFRETNSSSPYYQPMNDKSIRYLPLHIRLAPGTISITVRPRVTEQEVRSGTLANTAPGARVSFISISMIGDAFEPDVFLTSSSTSPSPSSSSPSSSLQQRRDQLANYFLQTIMNESLTCNWLEQNPARVVPQNPIDAFGFCGKMRQSLLKSAAITNNDQLLTIFLSGDDDFDVYLQEFIEVGFPQPELVIDQEIKNETTNETISVTYKYSDKYFYLNTSFASGFLPTLTRDSGFIIEPVQGRFSISQGFSRITEDEIRGSTPRSSSSSTSSSSYRISIHLENERFGGTGVGANILNGKAGTVSDVSFNLATAGFVSSVGTWQLFGWSRFGGNIMLDSSVAQLSANQRDLTIQLGFSSQYRISMNETIVMNIPLAAILSPYHQPLFDAAKTPSSANVAVNAVTGVPYFNISASPGSFEVYPRLIKASWLNTLPKNVTDRLLVLRGDGSSSRSKLGMNSDESPLSIVVALSGDEFDHVKLGNFWKSVMNDGQDRSFLSSSIQSFGIEPRGFENQKQTSDRLFDRIREFGLPGVQTVTNALLQQLVDYSLTSFNHYFSSSTSSTSTSADPRLISSTSCLRTKNEFANLNQDFCDFVRVPLARVPNYQLYSSSSSVNTGHGEILTLSVTGQWTTSGVAPIISSSSSSSNNNIPIFVVNGNDDKNKIVVLPTYHTINAVVVSPISSPPPSWTQLRSNIAGVLNLASEEEHRIHLSSPIFVRYQNQSLSKKVPPLNNLFSSVARDTVYFVSFRIALPDADQSYVGIDPVNGIMFDDNAAEDFVKTYSLTRELFQTTRIAACWLRGSGESIADDYLTTEYNRNRLTSNNNNNNDQDELLVNAFEYLLFPLSNTSVTWRRLADIIELAFFQPAGADGNGDEAVLSQISDEARTNWLKLPIVANPEEQRQAAIAKQKEDDEDDKKVRIILAVFIPIFVIIFAILIGLILENKYGCIARWREERAEKKIIQEQEKSEREEMLREKEEQEKKEKRQRKEAQMQKRKQQQEQQQNKFKRNKSNSTSSGVKRNDEDDSADQQTPMIPPSPTKSPTKNNNNNNKNAKSSSEPQQSQDFSDYKSPFAEFVKDKGEGTLVLKGAVGTGVVPRGGQNNNNNKYKNRQSQPKPTPKKKAIHSDLAMFDDDFFGTSSSNNNKRAHSDDEDDDEEEMQSIRNNDNNDNSQTFNDDDDDLFNYSPPSSQSNKKAAAAIVISPKKSKPKFQRPSSPRITIPQRDDDDDNDNHVNSDFDSSSSEEEEDQQQQQVTQRNDFVDDDFSGGGGPQIEIDFDPSSGKIIATPTNSKGKKKFQVKSKSKSSSNALSATPSTVLNNIEMDMTTSSSVPSFENPLVENSDNNSTKRKKKTSSSSSVVGLTSKPVSLSSVSAINDLMDPIVTPSGRQQQGSASFDPFFDDDYDQIYGVQSQHQQQQQQQQQQTPNRGGRRPVQNRNQQNSRSSRSRQYQNHHHNQRQQRGSRFQYDDDEDEFSDDDDDEYDETTTEDSEPDYHQAYNHVESSNYFAHPTSATHAEKFGGTTGGTTRGAPSSSSVNNSSRSGSPSRKSQNPLQNRSNTKRNNNRLPLPPSSPPVSGSSLVQYGGSSSSPSPKKQNNTNNSRSSAGDQEALSALFGDL